MKTKFKQVFFPTVVFPRHNSLAGALTYHTRHENCKFTPDSKFEITTKDRLQLMNGPFMRCYACAKKKKGKRKTIHLCFEFPFRLTCHVMLSGSSTVSTSNEPNQYSRYFDDIKQSFKPLTTQNGGYKLPFTFLRAMEVQ